LEHYNTAVFKKAINNNNTVSSPAHTFSVQWLLRQPVPGTIRQLSWSSNWQGRRPTSQESPGRTRIYLFQQLSVALQKGN